MGALTSDEARKIAESLWQVDWTSESEGFIECPGNARHTKSNAATDCRIMLEGGKPPTIYCVHASCADEVDSANFRLRSALGKAEANEGWRPEKNWQPPAPVLPKPEKPKYDYGKLEQFSGEWASVVDLAWLANRSVLEPSRVTSFEFLSALYRREQGEKVLVFRREFSQGEAVWPDDKMPTTGKNGIWFLAQPVDGEFRPQAPRKKGDAPTMSRRSKDSVRDWRFMVIESDEAPSRLWLGAVVQLPLRISAIYTSGGKSVHILVRVDARLKEEWEREKAALLPGLLTLGADPKTLSGVRLTRLPDCWRQGKTGADGSYTKFPQPKLQKLLYLNPEPLPRPISEILPRRDVLGEFKKRADWVSKNFGKMSKEELEAFYRLAWYYAPVSDLCRQVEEEFRDLVGAD